MNTQHTKVVIVENLDDHEGYNGEPLTVVSPITNDYFIVENAEGKQWTVGEEEIKPYTPTQHTAGEWIVCPLSDGSFAIKEAKLFKNGEWQFADRIAEINQYPEAEANAKLIASSPKLLEALFNVYDSLQTYINGVGHGSLPDGFTDEQFEAIATLLEKATSNTQ